MNCYCCLVGLLCEVVLLEIEGGNGEIISAFFEEEVPGGFLEDRNEQIR